ncbi:hypothetical protein GCM10025762_05140 [Haloechinothrix salitolerans]
MRREQRGEQTLLPRRVRLPQPRHELAVVVRRVRVRPNIRSFTSFREWCGALWGCQPVIGVWSLTARATTEAKP